MSWEQDHYADVNWAELVGRIGHEKARCLMSLLECQFFGDADLVHIANEGERWDLIRMRARSQGFGAKPAGKARTGT